ncbi:FG-GAP-like repeat-containing protein [Hymenobacter sp. GOD-10R]|uniref:FG-GAP-like repeat-containing protein n=1 Tax=Hymenobacter sp. GOD-10R TaxID=3093922 RepID=UPI002D76BAE2|nr:FG-GAP-like repeat-containing protein [Hymenobacter sp. GOD-10R]WRQ31841.1 FG-GAP-like repeat-containing protein [Hymenobacter sp. GOD-10R]
MPTRLPSATFPRQHWGKPLPLLALGLSAQAQLTVTSTTPVRNRNLAPRATAVKLIYSQPLNAGSASNVRVYSAQRGGQLVRDGNVTASSSTVTVNPAMNFLPGERVFVTSPATVTSSAGVASQPYVYQFTTATTPASGTFASKADFNTGESPYSVALGDVNADGRLDIVTASRGDNSVSVLLGQANSSFAAKTHYSTGNSIRSAALGDVNGDGRLDIVTANFGPGTVSVLLGQAEGLFAARMDYPTGAGTNSVALGDVNGDGRLDLVTANISDNSVSVLLGQAQGTFAAKTDYPVGGEVQSAALGDVNDDGRLDIVTANESSSVSVLLSQAQGLFGARTDYPTGASTNSVALGDVNEDGRLDIVTANRDANSVSVLLSQAAGTFAAKTDYPTSGGGRGVALGDVDGDGRLDIVTANGSISGTVSVLLGQAQGTFAAKADYPAGTRPYGLALGDVNEDGRLDIVTANRDANSVSVLLGQVPLAPTLTSFSPLNGPVGTRVTIMGTGLNGATAVRFNGTAASSFIVNSATSLTAVVAAGSTTGPVSVTTPSGTATSTTNFTVLFAPVVTTTANPTTALEQTATVVDAGLTVTDADSPNLASATVTLSSGLVSSEDVLAFTPTAPISGGYTASTGVLTLTGTASVAQYRAVLRTVSYRNSSQTPTTSARTVSFVVSDGELSSTPATKQVQVQAVNGAPSVPTDSDPTLNTVAENAPTGTLVGLTVTATDADSPTLAYSLTNNAGGRFAINPTTGVVTVANDRLLDYETATSHAITVQASDGTLTSSASFTIQVTNINEVPVVANQAFSVPASSPAGTVVGTVVATDPDAGQTLTYSITAGNPAGAFSFVGNQLQVANAAVLTSTGTYALTVSVQDNGSPSLASTATITVTVTPVTQVLYRLHAGGPALNTSFGAFAADQFFSPSRTGANSGPIAGTTDDALYQTERFEGAFGYSLRVPNGTYQVVLHFAELYWTQPGQRVFDVRAENQLVLDNYDILKKVAPFTATTETFSVVVTDGVLNLDLSALESDGGRDAAKLSALEVLAPGAAQNRSTLASQALLATTSPGKLAARLEALPNPFSERVSLSFQLPQAEAYTLTVYDLAGRQLQQQTGMAVAAGERQQLTLTLGRYPIGVYLVRLTTPSGTQQVRVVKH